MTAQQLFDHIRVNLHLFLDPSVAEFKSYSPWDQKAWESNNIMNTVMTFHIRGDNIDPTINIDDAAVIVTSATDMQWIFTTITAPKDGTHPVSGNRMFALVANKDGTYTFFTKGADILTNPWDQWWGDPDAFNEADKLWDGLRDKVIQYIERFEGEASKETKYWNQIKLD
jgi:hypothetical protein